MPANHRNEKIEDILLAAASKFFLEESAGSGLVTMTNVSLSEKADRATLFSVLPQDKEKPVLEFAKRKRSEFREFLKKETRIQRLPFIDFEIDRGEKNRQRIDEIGNEI